MPDPVTLEFPKKLNRKSFSKIRRAYKRQTGKELCEALRRAHRQSITDIRRIPAGKAGKDLRTHLNKLLDYDYALRFCKRNEK